MADDKEAKVATKSYTLKPGAEHIAVVSGERRVLKGGAKVELTEKQFNAFKDKFVDSESPEAFNTQNTTTITVGEETGGRATIPEGAATAGEAMGLEDDNVKTSEINDEPVARPAGSETVDVSGVHADTKAKAAPAKKDQGSGQAGGAAAGTASKA